MLSVALTPDGQWVLSGSKDRGVQFWDPRTGSAQLMLQGHKNSGRLFLFLSFPCTRCCDAGCSGDLCEELVAPKPGVGGGGRGKDRHDSCGLTLYLVPVISVAPSPSGNLFATGSGDMRARIWRFVSAFLLVRFFVFGGRFIIVARFITRIHGSWDSPGEHGVRFGFCYTCRVFSFFLSLLVSTQIPWLVRSSLVFFLDPTFLF